MEDCGVSIRSSLQGAATYPQNSRNVTDDRAVLRILDDGHDHVIGQNAGSVQCRFLVSLLISYRGKDPCHVDSICPLAFFSFMSFDLRFSAVIKLFTERG
jgi:hypothetical protein